MTREQEISKVALEYANEELMAAPYDAFMAGAEWADEHPVNYDGKAMLYVNNKSHENGYKEAVNKACEWLKNYAHMYVSETTGDVNEDDLINAFRNTMEGGEE